MTVAPSPRVPHGERVALPAIVVALATIAILLIASLPEGAGRSSSSAAADVTRDAPIVRVATGVKARSWVVTSGDSFDFIARNTGVSVATLARLNPSRDPHELRPGQHVRIR